MWLRQGKGEAAKFLHMVFAVARDPAYQPAIIYMDRVEEFFAGKKKSGPWASKFKKDLIPYVKSLKPVRYAVHPSVAPRNRRLILHSPAPRCQEERVVIIGNTAEPGKILDGLDAKGLKEFLKDIFHRYLYLPAPDYATRAKLWKHFLRARLGDQLPDDLDMSALARISAGYTAGAIKQAVSNVLSERRVESVRLAAIPRLSPPARAPNSPHRLLGDAADVQAPSA